MAKISRMSILAGNSVPVLADSVAQKIGTRFSLPSLTKAEIKTFSDKEISVEILDPVRGRDIYIFQSICAPVNDNLMEIILMADALKRSDAKTITAVIPYLGYSRQDRRPKLRRMPISARVIADMIATSGIDRVVTVDIHAEQIQGFYSIPMISVGASSLFVADIYKNYPDCVIVSPDAGGVERARSVAKQIDADLAVIDKRRPKPNVAKVMNILGDVEDRDCSVVDDMIDTAGTLCKGAKALKDRGAKRIVAYCTHPVLSGPAIDNINDSVLDEVVVTDTIPVKEKKELCDKIRVISLGELLAETVSRIQVNESVSSIYMMD